MCWGWASEMPGRMEQFQRQLWGWGGADVNNPSLCPMLKLHNYLASNSGYGYILGVFVHSCNQPTFMEHLLFVENLFVNSTMQPFNLLIKYLLVIHVLVHSFALSGELTRKNIYGLLIHFFTQPASILWGSYLSTYPFTQICTEH